MNIRTIGLVARREFVTRVRRRAFVLGIVLAPVLLLVLMAIGYAIGTGTEETKRVVIVDHDSLLSFYDSSRAAHFPQCWECFPQTEDMVFQFRAEPMSDEEFLASSADLLVEFNAAILQHGNALMYYEKSPSLTTQARLAEHLSEGVERAKLKRETTLDYTTYKRLKTDVNLLGQNIVTQDGDALGKAAIGFSFSLVLFIFLLVYSMHVMRGVIEEKANRIVEVVLRAVRPSELMAGKIIGIGAVGVVQFLAYAVLGGLVSWIGGSILTTSGVLAPGGEIGEAPVTLDLATWLAGSEELGFLLDVNWGLMIGATLFFFITGYALYAALFAAVGALVDQESDAQYLMMPAFLPLMASYILAVFAMQDPEGSVAYVASFVPFTAPILMLIRIPVGVPLHELVLSGLGVMVTAWLCMLFAGRIYRTGIFMYGKRPTFLEAWKWMRRGG